METKNARKCKKFICEKCDYISYNKSNYNMPIEDILHTCRKIANRINISHLIFSSYQV